MHYQYLQAPQ